MRDPLAAARDDFPLCARRASNLNEQRSRRQAATASRSLDATTIYYRLTFSDRQNFTVAHELAHQLVENDDKAIDWITLASRAHRSSKRSAKPSLAGY
ncbi:MAG: hypothetical protein M5U14_16615 [Acidimicrobiia bacterium]|nr:hypothetical protein [Acidimicrobiia bacterium]